ncbi:unnamed protein product [Closterium sp. Naga37s-1]|nr:unnamed protein product [Closterium sp. Naga37s-1]
MVDVPLESLHPGMVKVQPGEEVVVCTLWTLMLFPDDSVLRHNPRDAVLKVSCGTKGYRESGEEVVVCTLWTLMLFPDDSVLRHNPRDAVLKWIQALKPRLVLLAEVDAALNGPFFLARVRETFRSMLAFISTIHSTKPDALISPVHSMWEAVLFRELINCVGCEGIQRLIRAERLEQWQERMRRLGFEAVGLGSETFAAMRETTEGRDGKFEVVSVGGAARLMWKGVAVVSHYSTTLFPVSPLPQQLLCGEVAGTGGGGEGAGRTVTIGAGTTVGGAGAGGRKGGSGCGSRGRLKWGVR